MVSRGGLEPPTRWLRVRSQALQQVMALTNY